jgi:cytochrome b pre-mRNA-processing protein 3
MIFKRFRLNPGHRKIDDLYGAIVAQSRRAAFYIGYGVPDTVDGRFDLIVLHMVLLLAHIDRAGSARDLGQNLFDLFQPILPLSMHWTDESLRRRWRVISVISLGA